MMKIVIIIAWSVACALTYAVLAFISWREYWCYNVAAHQQRLE